MKPQTAPPRRKWATKSTNDIAYDFIKSKGFTTVTEAIQKLGFVVYKKEFLKFKKQ